MTTHLPVLFPGHPFPQDVQINDSGAVIVTQSARVLGTVQDKGFHDYRGVYRQRWSAIATGTGTEHARDLPSREAAARALVRCAA